MLVLTRTVGTSVVIGDDITVTVLRIDGHQVRLGFEAPREVPLYRRELLDAPRRNDEVQP